MVRFNEAVDAQPFQGTASAVPPGYRGANSAEQGTRIDRPN